METKRYLSPSFFVAMRNHCQAERMATEAGLWVVEPTKPMLIGGYIDAHFSGTLDQYKEREAANLFKKNGELYADFLQAEEIIRFAEADPFFMRYVTGEMQFKLEGEIEGVNFLGYADVIHENKAIVDVKIVRSIRDRVWDEETRQKINFIQAGGYLYQLAIYRELYRQKTGKTVACYIAALSKDATPDKEVIHLSDWALDHALFEVKQYAAEYLAIRMGDVEPKRCESCDYCRSTRMLTKPLSYDDLF